MKILYTSLLAALMVLPTSLLAQNSNAETNGTRRFWQASLPGGDYIVSLSSISSVSKHSYVIDGGLKVSEVIVDTNGNSLARFYYITPVTGDSALGSLTERSKELLDTAGGRTTGTKPSTIVAKQFPTTTHAKTVEFRLSSEKELDRLLNSVRRSWMNNNEIRFTIAKQ